MDRQGHVVGGGGRRTGGASALLEQPPQLQVQQLQVPYRRDAGGGGVYGATPVAGLPRLPHDDGGGGDGDGDGGALVSGRRKRVVGDAEIARAQRLAVVHMLLNAQAGEPIRFPALAVELAPYLPNQRVYDASTISRMETAHVAVDFDLCLAFARLCHARGIRGVDAGWIAFGDETVAPAPDSPLVAVMQHVRPSTAPRDAVAPPTTRHRTLRGPAAGKDAAKAPTKAPAKQATRRTTTPKRGD